MDILVLFLYYWVLYYSLIFIWIPGTEIWYTGEECDSQSCKNEVVSLSLTHHEITFFHLCVGVRCHTGLMVSALFLSCRDRNSDERGKKKIFQCWNVLPLKLQAGTASWLWSAQRANTYPLEKQERWLLQLLLETSSPCEPHLYTLFRLIVQI